MFWWALAEDSNIFGRSILDLSLLEWPSFLWDLVRLQGADGRAIPLEVAVVLLGVPWLCFRFSNLPVYHLKELDADGNLPLTRGAKTNTD